MGLKGGAGVCGVGAWGKKRGCYWTWGKGGDVTEGGVGVGVRWERRGRGAPM